MPVIKTKRLIIKAMNREELAAEGGVYERHLERAVEQSGGDERKPAWLFCTHWKILLKGSEPVLIGDVYFKGQPVDGSVVIGYMIAEDFRKQGYGAEAVEALVQWAEEQDDVFFVDADVEPDNVASIKLLEKCGFAGDGTDPETGRLLFVYRKEPVHYMSIYMLIGMSLGMSLGSSRGNMSLGMSMGIAIGLALGAALDAAQKKKLKKLEGMRNTSRKQ